MGKNKSIDEIRELVVKKQYSQALELLEKMEMKEELKEGDLAMFAEIYIRNKKYKKAKALLEVMFNNNASKTVISQLIFVCIIMNDFKDAENYYLKYNKIAPGDSDTLLLRYRLDKAQRKSNKSIIATLEKIIKNKFVEELAYELANLYLEEKDTDNCLKVCNKIIKQDMTKEYVNKAKKLKEECVEEAKSKNNVKLSLENDIWNQFKANNIKKDDYLDNIETQARLNIELSEKKVIENKLKEIEKKQLEIEDKYNKEIIIRKKYENKLQKCENYNKELEKRLDKEVEEKNVLREELELIKQEKLEYSSNLRFINSQKEDTERKLKNIDEMLKRQSEKLDNEIAHSKSLQEEKKEIIGKYEYEKRNVKMLEDKLNSILMEKNEIEEKLYKSDSNKKILETNLKDSIYTRKILENKCSQYMEHKKYLENRMSELETEKKYLETENKKQGNNLVFLQDTLRETDEKNKTLEKEMESEVKKLTEKNEIINNLLNEKTAQFETEKNQLEERLSKSMVNNKMLDQNLKNKIDIINSLDVRIKSVMNEKKILTEQKKQLENKLLTQIDNNKKLDEIIQKHIEGKKFLEEQIEKGNACVTALNEKNAQGSEIIRRLENQLQQEVDKYHKLENQLQEIKEKCSNLENELKQKEIMMREARNKELNLVEESGEELLGLSKAIDAVLDSSLDSDNVEKDSKELFNNENMGNNVDNIYSLSSSVTEYLADDSDVTSDLLPEIGSFFDSPDVPEYKKAYDGEQSIVSQLFGASDVEVKNEDSSFIQNDNVAKQKYYQEVMQSQLLQGYTTNIPSINEQVKKEELNPQIFTYYYSCNSIMEQVQRGIYNIKNNYLYNNFVITGPQCYNKSDLSKMIANQLHEKNIISTHKIARISGEGFNKVDLDSKVENLLDGCVVIQKAEELTSVSYNKLINLITTYEKRIIIILESDKDEYQLFSANRNIQEYFGSSIKLPEYSIELLMSYIKTHLVNNNMGISQEAEGVLINIMNKKIATNSNGIFTLLDLMQFINTTIEAASKRKKGKGKHPTDIIVQQDININW